MSSRIDSNEYYGIKILKDGTWLYQGSPITRHNLVKLFASVLHRDDKGGYWLVTPFEKGRIEVEDAPFTAVELKSSSSGESQTLLFRTNLDDWIEAGEEHPLRVEINPETGEPSPYILVRAGLEALIVRSVYYELVKLAVADETKKGLLGLWSRNIFFPIGKI
ncbi:MAG: DUF1285 domain-containing protein [Alphaproteobacteria bacterium]|nr:DUF1285 domain-containing protein [Alphaproteobacteria bacterium]